MTESIYRAQTDPPTTPGWYYAMEEGFTIPVPTWVLAGGELKAQGHAGWRALCFFRWYGPVPQVRLGSAPDNEGAFGTTPRSVRLSESEPGK